MNKIKQNISIKNLNTFSINCIAREYVSIDNIDDLKNIQINNYSKFLILGGGSNMVLPDFFDGLVIENNLRGIEIIEENPNFTSVKAGAGEIWDLFVQYLLSKNINGFENLALIPGKVGAAPIQNIGAYGIEQEKYFEKVEVYNFETEKIEILYKEQCNFGYRDSIFKHKLKNKCIITNVYYKFPNKWQAITDYHDIKKEIGENPKYQLNPKNIYNLICKIRNRKLPNPKEIANCGSFFKNPIVSEDDYEKITTKFSNLKGYKVEQGYKLSAARLIEKAGWKGKKLHKDSKAYVSPQHSLVIVGENGVNQAEIIALSQAIIDDIFAKFNIKLEREVNIIE